MGRPCGGLAASRRDRPLRLHHRAEAVSARRLHQDPQRHRRAGGPALGAVDQGRRDRPPDAERVRRGDLDQHRPASSTSIRRRARSCPAPTPTSSCATRNCRRPSRPPTRSRSSTTTSSKASRSTGCRATRCRAARWSGRTARTISRSPAAAAASKRKPFPAVAKALSPWKELTAPRAVTRSAEHMPIGV